MRFFKRKVYLDHNATTPVSYPVRRTMNRILKHYWGNASSGYRDGKNAHSILEQSREQVAKAMHAFPHEVYFTSCATEANNAVLQTLSNHFYPQKKKIVSTPIEHPSIMNTLEYLSSRGIVVEYCPVDIQGFVIESELRNMLDEDTFLFCCLYANNEIGSIQNIRQLSTLAHERQILVLSDCVQAFGKVPVNVKEMGVDYATFSAHKLYGPKGAGALYAKISSPIMPFIHGGHQEEGMRAGTEALHNIAGFGKACGAINKLISGTKNNIKLKQQLISELKRIMPDLIINSPDENCLPNTISVTLPGINSRELMMMLDYYGIAVSSGSACSSVSSKPSHVLKAIGLSDSAARETLRISLGTHSVKKDILYTLKVMKEFMKPKC